jgi:hypothetical protein
MPIVIERENPKPEPTIMTKVRSFVSLKRRIDDLTKEQSVI